MFYCFYKGVTKVRNILLTILISVPLSTFADEAPASADTAAGEAVYSQTCIACHGSGGKGTIPGVPDFTDAEGVLSKSDTDLLNNISNGFQSPGSFMAMPAKGGNPALIEADIKAVLVYIRTTFGK